MASVLTLLVEDFRYNGNGTITLHFPSRPIPREVQKMVEEFLPNTGEQFYKLLNKEILIESIAEESDLLAERTEKVVNKFGIDFTAQEREVNPLPPKKNKI